MARTGPFLWAKAVNHHLESDRRTAPMLKMLKKNLKRWR